MKKILFVEPRGAYSNVFAKTMTIPLLGPVYLGTIAKNAGYEVSIINENIIGRDIRPQELNADILCMTCLTTNVNRGIKIAKLFKSLNPNGRTIIGGIHASMQPHYVAPHFDQVVVGEGEEVLLDLLSGKINDKIVYTRMPRDLDKFPSPDFSLIKDSEKIRVTPIMGSRGCPYNCNFCSVTEMFGRGYRVQSPERVVDDLLKVKKGTVFFSDDHFAANMKRTNRILDMIIDSGNSTRWSAQVRTEVTKDEKFVAKMREANCKTVCIGFESVNPDSLEDLNKNQTVQDIERSIKVFHDHGINIHGMFMFGTDSDTMDVFRTTSNFCQDNEVDFAQFAILTPLPGTGTYFQLEKEGRLLHRNWDYYDGLHTVFKPKHMTASELQQGMLDCFGEFYSYTNAINNAITALVDSSIASVKTLYTKAHFPSLYPTIMKVAGKEILHNWIEHNKHYLDYLSKISQRFELRKTLSI